MEARSLRLSIDAYLNYSDAAQADVERCERSFKKLSPSHKALLSHLPSKYERLRQCISANSNFIINMVQEFEPPVDKSLDVDHDRRENMENMNGDATSDMEMSIPWDDVDKVRRIIRNIVRDWALEGKKERDECYKPILDELRRLFPAPSTDSPPRCLVPGAGLGRLALEISRLGFQCQGIDLSSYMTICSSFILNHTRDAGEWTIYPWIHSNGNSLSDDDQLRPVTFPDLHPATSAGITEGFSMRAGNFLELYGDPSREGTWDAVVTCFFIDTASNVVEYIEIISKILKPGGVWVNFGPLLYHFGDSNEPHEMSIELSLEDVKRVSLHYGFEIEMETTAATTFSIDRRSMMQNWYYPAFWTMRKRALTEVRP